MGALTSTHKLDLFDLPDMRWVLITLCLNKNPGVIKNQIMTRILFKWKYDNYEKSQPEPFRCRLLSKQHQ